MTNMPCFQAILSSKISVLGSVAKQNAICASTSTLYPPLLHKSHNALLKSGRAKQT